LAATPVSNANQPLSQRHLRQKHVDGMEILLHVGHSAKAGIEADLEQASDMNCRGVVEHMS
jgi:hypothetical protein